MEINLAPFGKSRCPYFGQMLNVERLGELLLKVAVFDKLPKVRVFTKLVIMEEDSNDEKIWRRAGHISFEHRGY